jgi:ribosomal protein S18 acetylase RimI-like enzyme
VADIVAEAYTHPGSDLSHEHVDFAEQNGAIIGMLSGYTGRQHRAASRKPLRDAVGGLGLRMKSIAILFAPMMRVLDSIAEDEYYLQAIAVDEDLRGQGIGSVLFDTYEHRARAAGSQRLALHVSAKNDGAIRLYERRGCTVESQWPRRIAIPGMRFYKMGRSL